MTRYSYPKLIIKAKEIYKLYKWVVFTLKRVKK